MDNIHQVVLKTLSNAADKWKAADKEAEKAASTSIQAVTNTGGNHGVKQ